MTTPESPQTPQFETAEYAQPQVITPLEQLGKERFVRSMVFGVAAAIAGAIGYALFGMLTGLMIGYISLGIGYMVGKAMMKGSGGFGGRRYQITAVLLTYMACAGGEMSIGVSQLLKQKPPAQAEAAKEVPASPSLSGFLIAIASLFMLALIFPFLELGSPISGLIGFVILFVGMRIAWQLTAGPSQSGTQTTL